jgi:hypothetical protein
MADRYVGIYPDAPTRALVERASAVIKRSAEIVARADGVSRDLANVIRRIDEQLARMRAANTV